MYVLTFLSSTFAFELDVSQLHSPESCTICLFVAPLSFPHHPSRLSKALSFLVFSSLVSKGGLAYTPVPCSPAIFLVLPRTFLVFLIPLPHPREFFRSVSGTPRLLHFFRRITPPSSGPDPLPVFSFQSIFGAAFRKERSPLSFFLTDPSAIKSPCCSSSPLVTYRMPLDSVEKFVYYFPTGCCSQAGRSTTHPPRDFPRSSRGLKSNLSPSPGPRF